MKIDRRSPRNWYYLLASGLLALLAVMLRPLRPRRLARGRVLLYGHKLGGNLLALYRYIRARPELGLDVVFLTLDPVYRRRLVDEGEACVGLTSPSCLPWLVTAQVLISDHGLHALLPLLHASDLRFVDVWHGIPFKGFDADDFRVQHRYDEVWVASPLMQRLYIERFGFQAERVIVTGYARTDALVHQDADTALLRHRFGLPAGGRIVLFAPTWKQDDAGRSLFPFGMEPTAFLGALEPVLQAHDACLVLRTHLNSPVPGKVDSGRVIVVPYAEQPDTESLLLVSDVLICDWSSIAFDYLVLLRPTLFLDVAPPFKKGFSLGAEYRFGERAGSLEQLALRLGEHLARDRMDEPMTRRQAEVLDAVYGGLADGRSTRRCIDRLLGLQARGGSSR